MSGPTVIPLGRLNKLAWCPNRTGEPVTVGIPLPKGLVSSPNLLELQENGRPAPIQVKALDHWPDGSVKWALVDCRVNSGRPAGPEYRLCVAQEPTSRAGTSLEVESNLQHVTVRTGKATFNARTNEPFPFGLIIDLPDRPLRPTINTIEVRETGPLRAEVYLSGTAHDRTVPLDVFARVELFSGTQIVRVQVTVRNRRRAQHPGGHWSLGDAGSLLIESVRLVLPQDSLASGVHCAPETGSPMSAVEVPFEIHQESSGGDGWDNATHKNRDGQVPLRFKGYRMRSGNRESFGTRATPIVTANHSTETIAAAVPKFWQNFPQSLSVTGDSLEIGLLAKAGDLHELQGGEQKTFSVVLAPGGDAVSETPLAWVHDPVRLYPTPEWCCSTNAMPFLVPESQDQDERYRALVRDTFDDRSGFFEKRERADEFGWRNFGDLPADHESAFRPPDQPLVSHYNNQYDAIAAFGMHFLRSGDIRYWRLMDDLARHVIDIDIYHTNEDKSAYNGGLFWHTNHYTDAGTATHRTYPPGGGASGGPAAEHNYNLGLMWHFFMTGETASRDAAVGLGQWVLAMDDGRLTPFGWIAATSTGLASASGSMSYHGPGRGAANSIMACLVAHQLTNERRFLGKAEELIRRCIHPTEDVGKLDLLDAERRWFYTVFLQALGFYLFTKDERGDRDQMYRYARASLLHYGRWMAEHERPYLSHPELLEFPTETWAAQDMRKADVLRWAAVFATGVEQRHLADRGKFFFDYSLDTLIGKSTRHYTRPIILVLANGVRQAGLIRAIGSGMVPSQDATDFQGPKPFIPQKRRAVTRLAWLAAAGFALAVTAFATWLASGR